MAVSFALDNRDLAKTYDEISDWQFNHGRTLVEKLGVKPGDTVLDIGSGTGRLGRYVIDIIGPTGKYTGIEPLAERVNIANEKNTHPNAAFRIGNAEDLSYVLDNSVDVVYLTSVFHWVADKETALKEILRVLKPGGKVGFTTGAKELNSISGSQAITAGVLKREPYSKVVRPEDITPSQGLTATELIQLLAEAGFAVKEVQVKAFRQTQATAEDVFRHSEASSFGNYLSNVPDSLREQAKADIAVELEKLRTKEGIQWSQYMLFAVAKKKQGVALVS